MTETQKQTKKRIDNQTHELSNQLEKIDTAQTDEDIIKELEKYQEMLKKADFSIESQAASKKQERTLADKVLAKPIRKLAKGINKVNRKLEEHNKKRGTK